MTRDDPQLTPDLILRGYCAGVFPMADVDGRVLWFSPDPRGIFPLDGLHVSRSLAKTIRRGVFEVRCDTAFADVIAACAHRSEGTWISDEIRTLYTELHQLGFAHSVEVWQEGVLAGGLYGIAIGGAFFGESMFHRARDASKVALAALVDRLRARGFTLLDTQWTTPHLERLGAIDIPREEYMQRLDAAIQLPAQFD